MRENRDIINYILYTPEEAAKGEPLQAQFSHQLKRFMDWMPGGFFIYRADGAEELLYANEATLRIFGCDTMEELRALTGGSFRGIVHPEDLDEVEESIRCQIDKSRYDLDYVEYRIIRKDGAVRWVDDYGHYIRSDAGDVFCVFVSDTTEKRMAQLQREHNLQSRMEAYHQELEGMSEEYLRRLEVIEGLSLDYESIFYIDLDAGTIQTYQISERMEDQFGQERTQPFEGFAEEYLHKWVCPEDRDRLAALLTPQGIREALSDKRTFDETYRILKNGESEYLQLHAVNNGEGRASKVILGAKSVDELIRGGMKRREVLENALQQATSAVVAKNAFLANMSHDMRTPMNAILGFTALARRNLNEAGKAQGYLDMIEASGNQLLKLVNNVLEIARMEAGKVQITERPGSFTELADWASKTFRPLAEEKKQTFTVALEGMEHPNVFADQEKVEEILALFLDNAFKYTPAGGEVGLELRELESANPGYGRYRLTVSDNGPGMEPAFLERLFAPFERENNTTVSGVPGTGLGLSIAKSLADMLGGEVEVHSEPGRGSAFSVTLTLRLAGDWKPSAGPEPAASHASHPRSWGKVLVVEDNELNQEIERELLEAEGFRVDTVWNGQEALERMKSAKPGEYAVILMDIQMPVMDGYEAARAIRALPDRSLARVPIVAVSANAFEEDKRRSSESGMNAHIAKPVSIPELMEVIERLLRDA